MRTIGRQNRRPSRGQPGPGVGDLIEVVWDAESGTLLSDETSS